MNLFCPECACRLNLETMSCDACGWEESDDDYDEEGETAISTK